MLARPAAKSVPIILVHIHEHVDDLADERHWSAHLQSRSSRRPAARSVNSAMLWPSNGLMKSSLMMILFVWRRIDDLTLARATFFICRPRRILRLAFRSTL